MIANLFDRTNIWLTGKTDAFWRWSEKSPRHAFAAWLIGAATILVAMGLFDPLFQMLLP